MKLVTVLMLTALPLYCYAGHGCDILNDMVSTSINSKVALNDYINNIQEFLPGEDAKKSFTTLKECFLQQSEETLEKLKDLQGNHLDILPQNTQESAHHYEIPDTGDGMDEP